MKKYFIFFTIVALWAVSKQDIHAQQLHNLQVNANFGFAYTLGFAPGTPTPVLLAPLCGDSRFAYNGGIFGLSLGYLYLYDTSRKSLYSENNNQVVKLRNTNKLIHGMDIQFDTSITLTGGSVKLPTGTFDTRIIKSAVGAFATYGMGTRSKNNILLIDLFGLGFSTAHIHYFSSDSNLRPSRDGAELSYYVAIPGLQVINKSGFTYKWRNRLAFHSSSVELENIISFDTIMSFGFTFNVR